ncbi:MAG: ankyrin repeat domain-containing protein [Blastocatellia bacterium]|nr:ankyrin repeat domain-containing protein [Blastocatellia bacterium]
MSRRLTILDRISVKSSCHEDWNQMKGNDTVRFCSHCSKSVHNLSEMTRSEAIKLVGKSNGKLCIQYNQGPDHRILTKPDLPHSALSFGRLGNLATGVFSLAAGVAVLGTPLPVWGQSADETVIQTVGSHATLAAKPHPEGNTVISGLVKDTEGTSIANAEVTITNQGSNEFQKTTSNEKGEFSLQVNPGCQYQVTINAAGYQVQNETFFAALGMETTIQAELHLVFRTIQVRGAIAIQSPSGPLVHHTAEREVAPEYPTEVTDFLTSILNEDVSTAKQMVRKGISVNLKLHGGDSPLMFAVNGPKILKYLLAKGAEVDRKNDFGVTPLMNAVSGWNQESVKILLRAGANVNAQEVNGLSPLMIAAMDDKAETISLLLSQGAKPDLRDKTGKTALGHALEHQAERAIEVLKKAGAKE